MEVGVSSCIWYALERMGAQITPEGFEGVGLAATHEVQEMLKTAPKDAENGRLCTGIPHFIDIVVFIRVCLLWFNHAVTHH